MKLLRCDECQDVFALKLKYRHCACGESGGRYVDPIKVEVVGPCRVFGIPSSFWSDSESHPRCTIFLIKEPNVTIVRMAE